MALNHVAVNTALWVTSTCGDNVTTRWVEGVQAFSRGPFGIQTSQEELSDAPVPRIPANTRLLVLISHPHPPALKY